MTANPVEGPRACRPDELPAMIRLVNSVMRETSDQSFLTDYPLVYRSENLGNVQIMRSGPDVVSVVPFLPKEVNYQGSHFRIGIISPTATHPNYRRLGYAHQCLQACISLMEQAGLELSVLWTLPATFPFYEAAGFHPVPPQMQWLHCTPQEASVFQKSDFYRIIPFQPQNAVHLAAIEALYQSEEGGIVRSSHDIATLFTLPRMATHLAVSPSGEIHGYLIYCTGTHKPGVLEARGPREAIESLLNHCLSTTPLPEVAIYLTLNAGNLSLLLHERLPSRIVPMEAGPMMVRINHRSRFLEAIGNRLEPECKEACRHLGESAMISLLFGSRGNPTSEVPPGYFPIPMLDHS